MPIKSFFIPVRYSEPFEAELNAFLKSHRVIDLSRQFVASGDQSFWAFSIEYLDGKPGAVASGTMGAATSKPRIDYRERLSAEDFAVFAQLRQLRKDLAAAESIPVYLVLTNEQLAQIVEKKVRSLTELGQIDGIGAARIEKYGARVVELLSGVVP